MNPYNVNVISSRLELSRSISGLKFVSNVNERDYNECLNTVKNALRFHKDSFYPVKYVSRNIAMYLHLYEAGLSVLPQKDEKYPGILFVRKDDAPVLSVQTNCTEHIVIRSACEGFEFDKQFSDIYSTEHHLQKFMNFRFSPVCGYITCRPDRAGTGLKVSVLLHLPAISKANALNSRLKTVQESGFILKQAYPEKKASGSALFLLENKCSSGMTENDLIGVACDLCNEICAFEEQIREKSFSDIGSQIKMNAVNACRSLIKGDSYNEITFMNLWSEMRYAAESGMFEEISPTILNKLLFLGMNGGVIRDKLKTDPRLSVDKLRAFSVKEYLRQMEVCI